MEMFLYGVVNYYSLFLLSFFLLRNDLKRSAPRIMLVWLAFTAAFSLLLLVPWLDYYRFHYLFVLYLYFLLTFLYIRKNTRIGMQKLLFISFLAIHFHDFQSMILFFAAGSSIFNVLFEGSGLLVNALGKFILSAVIIFAMHRFIEPFLKQIKSRDIKGLWLVPFMFYCVETLFSFSIFFIGAEDSFQSLSSWIYTIFISVIVVAFIVYVLLIRTLSGIAKNTQMESENTLIVRQLELQKEFYERLQTNIKETKVARHDLRHHLSLVQSYINDGETARLKSYVNEYTNTLPTDIETVFCENFAVNSIMRYYVEIAENEGIHTDIRLDLPENTGISVSDLCIVFGNCMENAIEACLRLSGDKFIKVNSKLNGKMLVITIDNSFDGELRKDDDIFLSRKHAGEGIGLSSVRAVARKYNEEARFDAKDNVFYASITLRAEHGL